MATATKPKSTTKTKPASKVEETEVKSPEVEASEVKVETPKVVSTPKKFSQDDMIDCRSVTAGQLSLFGPKSKLMYEFMDYGDHSSIPFGDLQALYSMRSRFLKDPLFVIEDEDVIEQFGSLLNPIYEKMKDEDMAEFFELPIKQFKTRLANSPTGFQNAVKTKAIQMIQSGELYDIRKIKAMDETLNTEFVQLFVD